MAEMAAYQGVDLYSFKSKNGTDIHDAISFLLNSLENTNVIHKYASRNLNPWRSGNGVTDPLDFKFQVGKDKIFKWQRDMNKSSFLSWYEIYKYRFPDHDNLKRLYKISNQTKKRLGNSIELPYEPPTPLYNDYSGMSPSCLYYKPISMSKIKRNTNSSSSFKLDKAKSTCTELGFRFGTEKHGECVLKMLDY
tara:strand:- start:49 stop:627 length:579 start_codon:yes stop_codon:yes gene_type:complete